MYVCMYSNFHNDVPRVAQLYGTIAAHTRRRASVLVVFVVFCVDIYSFYDKVDAQRSLGADILVYPVGVEPSTSCVQGEHPIH